jgi:hypothetical protein
MSHDAVAKRLSSEQMEKLYLLAYACSPFGAGWAGWPLREDVAVRWIAKQNGESADALASRVRNTDPEVRASTLRWRIYANVEETLCDRARRGDPEVSEVRPEMVRACDELDRVRTEEWFEPGRRDRWRDSARTALAQGCNMANRARASSAALVERACGCQVLLLERMIPPALRATPWKYGDDGSLFRLCAAAVLAVNSVPAAGAASLQRAPADGPAGSDACERLAQANGAEPRAAVLLCSCLQLTMSEEAIVAGYSAKEGERDEKRAQARARVLACEFAAGAAAR